jgi:hypothetical protein
MLEVKGTIHVSLRLWQFLDLLATGNCSLQKLRNKCTADSVKNIHLHAVHTNKLLWVCHGDGQRGGGGAGEVVWASPRAYN